MVFLSRQVVAGWQIEILCGSRKAVEVPCYGGVWNLMKCGGMITR